MSCSATLSGLTRDCETNRGGLKGLYIGMADDVSSVTLDATSNKITAITMASGKKFKGFYFRPGQASFTLSPSYNDAGEYNGENATISVNFGKMDSTKRAQISALAMSELKVIALDNNGIYWYFGYDIAVRRNGGDSQTGAAASDRNQYGLQLSATDFQLPYEVESSAAAAVIE